MQQQNFYKLLLWVSIFAIAMGFLETAIVVYLRELYYPEGFNFPLAPISSHIALTEILREAATVIMLICIGYFAGRSFACGFAWFIYTFAVWDIFYYIFLKILLNWPESFMTDDVLFLIPVTWVGPVITPIIVALSMIFLAIIIVWFESKGIVVRINKMEWTLLILGSLVLIVGFTWDYSAYLLEKYSFSEIFTLPNKDGLFEYASKYIPRKFNWFLYVLGEGLILGGIGLLWKRLKGT